MKEQVLEVPEKMVCEFDMSEEEAAQFKYYLDKMLKEF